MCVCVCVCIIIQVMFATGRGIGVRDVYYTWPCNSRGGGGRGGALQWACYLLCPSFLTTEQLVIGGSFAMGFVSHILWCGLRRNR